MKMHSVVLACVLLAGCGAGTNNLLNDAKSVREYYDNDQLRDATIQACRTSDMAKVRENLARDSCKNALEARSMKAFGRKPE